MLISYICCIILNSWCFLLKSLTSSNNKYSNLKWKTQSTTRLIELAPNSWDCSSETVSRGTLYPPRTPLVRPHWVCCCCTLGDCWSIEASYLGNSIYNVNYRWVKITVTNTQNMSTLGLPKRQIPIALKWGQKIII